MKPSKKQLFARRGVLLFVSIFMATSAQAAKSPGVRYSDFLKHDATDLSTSLTIGSGLAPAYAALSAVDDAGLFGLNIDLSDIIAVGVVVGSVIGLAAVAGEDAATAATTSLFAQTQRSCLGAESGRVYRRSGLESDYINEATNAAYSHYVQFSGENIDADANGAGALDLFDRLADLQIQEHGSFEFLAGVTTHASVLTLRDRVREGTANTDLNLHPVIVGLGLEGADPSDIGGKYFLFQQNGKVFFAQAVNDDDGNQITCSEGDGYELTADQFALAGGVVPSGKTVFSLQDGWRGYLGDDVAVRLGDFFFRGDSEMQNLHLEQQLTPWASEGFALHTDSGYKRWNDSRLIYSKMTAKQTLSPQLDIYAQAAVGDLQSASYRNSAMHGFALGAFYEQLLSHDDSYHVRLEQRFAAVTTEEWRLAADTSIGTAGDYLRLGVYSQIDDSEIGAHIFYSREF